MGALSTYATEVTVQVRDGKPYASPDAGIAAAIESLGLDPGTVIRATTTRRMDPALKGQLTVRLTVRSPNGLHEGPDSALAATLGDLGIDPALIVYTDAWQPSSLGGPAGTTAWLGGRPA